MTEPAAARSVHGRAGRLTIGAFVGVPLLIVVALVWLPALASVILSFTDWNGVGGTGTIRFIGVENYEDLVAVYPPFWSAVGHNLLWLAGLLGVATPLGIALSVALDRRLRGARLYQTALYLPLVLSLAVIGFVLELQLAPEQGLVNGLLGRTSSATVIDWLGDRRLNIWAALVAAGWRHVGYVVLLYLAGLRSLDPAMRDAAELDGAGEIARFRFVTFPAMRPVNALVVVVTAIEAVKAFDIVYVVNRGLNGLELLSVLVTNNLLGEASRVGFGSAIATILLVASVPPIAWYLRRAFGEPAS